MPQDDLVINVRAILNDWDVQRAYKRLERARHASMELSPEESNLGLSTAAKTIHDELPKLEKELHDALWNAFHVRVICQLLTEAGQGI
jgi:hypothetical protein